MTKIQIRLSALLLAALLLGGGTAFADGSAPVAENLELRTYRNVSVGGRLSAFDAEDDVVSYTITTEPVKGSIELEEDGCFVYTPRENKRGRDYFGYKAVDSEGNLSEEATVIIRIEKQKKSVVYSDLQGDACEAAAVLLHEKHIFTGETLGGLCCFCPEQAVSRGEFLTMCAALNGRGPTQAVLRCGYEDEETIPAWVMGGCVSLRLRGAAPTGERLEPFRPITAGEAAELLSKALTLNPVRYLSETAGDTQACRDLLGHGIPVPASETVLTRAQAAEMLAAAIRLREEK